MPTIPDEDFPDADLPPFNPARTDGGSTNGQRADRAEVTLIAYQLPCKESGPTTLPTAEALAAAFCVVLREWLKPEELAEAVKQNLAAAANGDTSTCASHDFCDANVAMEEAFKRHGVDVCDTGTPDTDHALMSKECYALWDEAWTLAKARGFAL